ncbi:hypothetical protein P3T23_006819 [Paraburkholderia sp. GAS448]
MLAEALPQRQFLNLPRAREREVGNEHDIVGDAPLRDPAREGVRSCRTEAIHLALLPDDGSGGGFCSIAGPDPWELTPSRRTGHSCV